MIATVVRNEHQADEANGGKEYELKSENEENLANTKEEEQKDEEKPADTKEHEQAPKCPTIVVTDEHHTRKSSKEEHGNEEKPACYVKALPTVPGLLWKNHLHVLIEIGGTTAEDSGAGRCVPGVREAQQPGTNNKTKNHMLCVIPKERP